MPVTAIVRDAAAEPACLDAAFASLREADALFSTYRPASEISRIARGELDPSDAGALVREVLGRCDELRRETDGYFDALASGTLDPSGLVKGWALDRAAALIDADVLCLDAGGDLVLRGGPWRVGIRDPRRRDRLAAVLELADAAVATSAAYERGEHILDPHARRPPRGVESVTIVGPDLATADAYATAAYAMGERGPRWTASLAGCEAMTILAGGRVLTTAGLPTASRRRPARSAAGR